MSQATLTIESYTATLAQRAAKNDRAALSLLTDPDQLVRSFAELIRAAESKQRGAAVRIIASLPDSDCQRLIASLKPRGKTAAHPLYDFILRTMRECHSSRPLEFRFVCKGENLGRFEAGSDGISVTSTNATGKQVSQYWGMKHWRLMARIFSDDTARAAVQAILDEHTENDNE